MQLASILFVGILVAIASNEVAAQMGPSIDWAGFLNGLGESAKGFGNMMMEIIDLVGADEPDGPPGEEGGDDGIEISTSESVEETNGEAKSNQGGEDDGDDLDILEEALSIFNDRRRRHATDSQANEGGKPIGFLSTKLLLGSPYETKDQASFPTSSSMKTKGNDNQSAILVVKST